MCLRHLSDWGSRLWAAPLPVSGPGIKLPVRPWWLPVRRLGGGEAAARVNADSPEQLIRAVVSAESGTEPSDDTSNARNCRFAICNKRSGKQKAFRDRSRRGATFTLDPWIARATPWPQSQPVPAARFRASLERSGLVVICSGEGSRRRAPSSWAAGLSGLACARNSPIALPRGTGGVGVVAVAHLQCRAHACPHLAPGRAAVRVLAWFGEQGWLHRVIEDGPSPDSRGRYGR
jgi:hypothetical protein